MPTARYWRAVGMTTYGDDVLELSAFNLYGGGGGGDTEWPHVSLLMNCDSFSDASLVPKTISTAGGALAVSSEQSQFGGSSLKFSNSGYLVVAAAEDLYFAGDFTFEFSVRSESLGSDPIFSCGGSTTYWYGGMVINNVQLASASAFGGLSSTAFHHIAICRKGATIRCFVNGGQVAAITHTAAINFGPLYFGVYIGNTYSRASGFIDNIRISAGIARYEAGFTPPVQAFPVGPNSGGTEKLQGLLTCTAGDVSALQDDDLTTAVLLTASAPGLALVWDLGGEKEVMAVELGAGSSEARFLSHFDLQYSSDGAYWISVGVRGRFIFPGASGMTALPAAVAPIPVGTSRSELTLFSQSPVPVFQTCNLRNAETVRDIEHGGPGTIYGTTKTKGTPNTSTKARVVLLHQRSKLPVREVWSDPVTGYFEFRGIDTAQQFIVLAEDAGGNFRPVAANRLTPEVLP